jgi:hypothetical protein
MVPADALLAGAVDLDLGGSRSIVGRVPARVRRWRAGSSASARATRPAMACSIPATCGSPKRRASDAAVVDGGGARLRSSVPVRSARW